MHSSNDRFLNLLPVGLIIILPFLLFWRWVVRGEVLFWGTSLLQFWPWHYLVKISLRNGEWPLWNPLLGNGTPLLANLQTAAFYPLNFIYLLMPVEHALTFTVILHLLLAGLFMYFYVRALGLLPFAATIAALSYMFSGYLVGRTQFVTMVNAAAWFPLLLLLSDKLVRNRAGINVLWLALALAVQLLAGHAQLWFYGLWLAGAYIVFRSWQTASRHIAPPPGRAPAPGEAILGATRRYLPGSAPSGQAKMRSYALRFTFLAGSVSKLTIAISLALLISAIQILPTAEFVSQSQRSTGAGRTFALTYSFWPWRLITLVAPDFFGNPAQDNFWGYANYWEDHAYVGVLPFLFALAALWYYFKPRIGKLPFRSKPEQLPPQIAGHDRPWQVVPFFAILIPISLLLAMGWNTPVYPWVFDNIVGFNFFQAPARLLIWYTIAMAVLAGVGAQFIAVTPKNRPNWRRLLAACVALTVAGIIGVPYLPGRESTFLDATITVGILLIISLTLLLIRPERTTFAFFKDVSWQGLIIIFVTIDLFIFAWPLLPALPATIYKRPIASAEFLKHRSLGHRYFVDEGFVYNTIFSEYFQFRTFGSPDLGHWQGLKETLVPNFGVYARLPSANNDDPLVVSHWQRLAQEVNSSDASRRAQLLALMNVGYFINNSTDAGGPIIYHNGNLQIQQVPHALPRAYFVSQAYYTRNSSETMARLTAHNFDSRREVVIMVREGEEPLIGNSLEIPELVPLTVNEQGFGEVQLTVHAPSSGFVVLTDTFYPGWQGMVDGQLVTVLQANLAFRAVAVEAGHHEIGFSYRPRSFMIGRWVSAAIGLITAGMMGWLLRRR